jgi:hypothetical protein
MAGPEKISGALNRALKGLNLEARMREASAMALWPDVVGEVTAAKTRPLYVNRGTMVVAVASSAWANQLNLLKPRLLQAIAERCGPDVIRDLRWKTGFEDDPIVPQASPARRIRRVERDSEIEVPATERQAIGHLTAGIPDPKLAQALERTLIAQAKRRERLKRVGWVPCKRCGVLHDASERPFLRPGSEPGPSKGEDPFPAALCPPCRMVLKSLLD